MRQLGMFDESERFAKLSKLGDSLETLQNVIDWNMFRPLLNEAMKKSHRGAGGRPPFDYLLMFKILVLQKIYNLSDEQTEYQINDRMSFMRFLGLGINDTVPDAKTIWNFRDCLTKAGVIKPLFDLFVKKLDSENLITRTGTIVDATFVEAPRPRYTKEEKEQINNGELPERYQGNIHKIRQTDFDARWTRKAGIAHYGYKDHVKVDSDSKFITDYATTQASVHDSQPMPGMIDEKDKVVYGDSAYWGNPVKEALPEGVETQICVRGTKYKPLTDEQKQSNRQKSKIRSRVEHVFGYMNTAMKGTSVRSIGLQRADFSTGLLNLVYDIKRYEFLIRQKKAKA